MSTLKVLISREQFDSVQNISIKHFKGRLRKILRHNNSKLSLSYLLFHDEKQQAPSAKNLGYATCHHDNLANLHGCISSSEQQGATPLVP